MSSPFDRAARTGSRSRHRPPRRLHLAAAIAIVVGIVLVGSPPSGAAPALSGDPVTGLTDFQFVRITGTGYEPGTLMEWFQCRGGAVDEDDCDVYHSDFTSSDGAGNVDEVIPVDARIYLTDGTEVDCRTDPAGCEIGVGYLLDADEWPEVALEFDSDAPLRPVVAGTVSPDRGLDDDLDGVDDVTVDVTGVTPWFETWAFLCGTGTEMWGRRCDLDRAARGVADDQTETVALALEARRRFTTPLGGRVDCSDPGSCEVVVSWGFSPQPDRSAAVPVSFAAQPAPTTTTTTTSPAPPPTAPPAVPVDGTAAFTG